MGSKFGIKHEYPSGISERLRSVLEAGASCMGDELERAELSSEVVEALVAEFDPEQAKRPAAPKATTPPRLILQVESKEESKAPAPKAAKDEEPKSDATLVAMLSDVVEEQLDQQRVETALSADVIVEMKKDSPEPKQRKQKEEKAEPPPVVTGEGGKDSTEDVKPVEEASNEAFDEEAIDNAAARLEEFISDARAQVIGNNEFYLATLRDDEVEVAKKFDYFIPTYDQVLGASTVKDLFSDELRKKLSEISFYSLSQAYNSCPPELYFEPQNAKRVITTFNKKLTKARAFAQQLFQRFNSKANAMNIALTTRRQVGSFDPTRAALYKIYDDVFKRRAQAPNQINHGYVLMLDWSSSMRETSLELFHRVAELSFFAQLAKVELDVWLYTTSPRNERQIAAAAPEKFPIGTMLTASNFTNVLNTSKHTGDALLFRLFGLFFNAANAKNNGAMQRRFDAPLKKLLDNKSFTQGSIHYQSGTNIFEALLFAQNIAEKMKANRRCIMLMTDGADNSFSCVISKNDDERLPVLNNLVCEVDFAEAPRVMLGGANVIEVMRDALSKSSSRFDKFHGPFANVRTAATAMIADSIRRQGTSVVGISWDAAIFPGMRCWARDNVIRINISRAEKTSRSLATYATVKNEFITHISEALLSNIKPTTANP